MAARTPASTARGRGAALDSGQVSRGVGHERNPEHRSGTFAQRPHDRRRHRRHRPPLRLELDPAAHPLRGRVHRLGGVPGHPGLPDPVATDAQRIGLSPVRRRLRALALAAGMLWALPWTLAGLLAGLVLVPLGARPRLARGECALLFARCPWGPGGALTLGNVILATGPDLEARCVTYEHRAGRCRHPAVRLGDHERAHVYQYMALGP